MYVCIYVCVQLTYFTCIEMQCLYLFYTTTKTKPVKAFSFLTGSSFLAESRRQASHQLQKTRPQNLLRKTRVRKSADLLKPLSFFFSSFFYICCFLLFLFFTYFYFYFFFFFFLLFILSLCVFFCGTYSSYISYST